MLSGAAMICRVAKHGLTSRNITSLIYYVTMRCNARCQMCLFWKKTWGSADKTRPTLSLEQIDTFSKSVGKLLRVEITGGEPFLRPDLRDVVLTVAGNCRPLMLTISTNGSLPDKITPVAQALCAEHPRTMVRLNVSIDAYGERHDEIRNVPGLYERCRETMKQLKETQKQYGNLTVNTSTVLSGYNLQGIGETLRQVRDDLKPDHLCLMLARGHTFEEKARDVPIEEYERILLELCDHMKKDSPGYLIPILSRAFGREIARSAADTVRQNRQVVPCLGGSRHIMVAEDGTLLPCDVLSAFLDQCPTPDLDSAKMSKLSDYNYSIPDALQSAQAKKVATFIKEGKCHCTSDCLFIPSLLLNPKCYPRLGMAVLRELWKS